MEPALKIFVIETRFEKYICERSEPGALQKGEGGQQARNWNKGTDSDHSTKKHLKKAPGKN